MNKHFLTTLIALIILGLLNSCTKNEQAAFPSSSAKTRMLRLGVPLEDGRKFIEIKTQGALTLDANQMPSNSGFTQIESPDQSYLSSTTLITIKKPGEFLIVSCISDRSLKVNFTDSVRKMPGYPSGWTAMWNSKPNVEDETPAVLYTRQQNRLTLQLSKYVTTFGFELAPNLYDSYPFSVGYYDSRENPQVAYLQEVASTPGGAKLFAVSSERPFNVVEISYARQGEDIYNPYGFAVANIRYKLAE